MLVVEKPQGIARYPRNSKGVSLYYSKPEGQEKSLVPERGRVL